MVCITYRQVKTASKITHVYEGHNTELSAYDPGDGGELIYRIKHKDQFFAPHATIYYKDGELILSMNFADLWVTEEDWPRVATAASEMLALWKEYNSSASSQNSYLLEGI